MPSFVVRIDMTMMTRDFVGEPLGRLLLLDWAEDHFWFKNGGGDPTEPGSVFGRIERFTGAGYLKWMHPTKSMTLSKEADFTCTPAQQMS